MERTMVERLKRIHPAIKHGGYSVTAILPGEDRAAFQKLHEKLIAEHAPSGILEHNTVETMARLVWRKQHLCTFRIAELAQARYSIIEEGGNLIRAIAAYA
jgi:hypothetical protein